MTSAWLAALPCSLRRRHLSPITIGVNISILGLSLYSAGWPVMGNCIQASKAVFDFGIQWI